MSFHRNRCPGRGRQRLGKFSWLKDRRERSRAWENSTARDHSENRCQRERRRKPETDQQFTLGPWLLPALQEGFPAWWQKWPLWGHFLLSPYEWPVSSTSHSLPFGHSMTGFPLCSLSFWNFLEKNPNNAPRMSYRKIFSFFFTPFPVEDLLNFLLILFYVVNFASYFF